MLQRLALSYSPSKVRTATLALFALDSRLASILRSTTEPMLAQIRLAWWREMLERDAAERPAGEPVLAVIPAWREHQGELALLVEGWEHLVGSEPLDESAMRAFCRGRGSAFAALAAVAGHEDARTDAFAAGEGWALADLAGKLDAPGERETAMRLVREHDWRRIALPRSLRPLGVLHGLATKAGRAGCGLETATRSAMLHAVRIGLFGR
jgi:phytoene synthase